MITVFGFQIQLPPELQFLSGTIGSFLATVLAWAIVTLVIYYAIFGIVRIIARRTETEVDDILLGILKTPLWVLLFSYGIVNSLAVLALPKEIVGSIQTIFDALLLGIVFYLAWRIVQDIVIHWAETYAEKSESKLDDVLVPILKRLSPLVLLVAGALLLLNLAGVELAGLLTVLGAMSFLLVFVFQEPLSNLFSGVYLLLDVPFRYGDLVILEDGKTYRVERIGTRVTELLSIDEHNLVFIPNNSLATQKLVNITKPTVELRIRIEVGVAYGTDPKKVMDLLEWIANAHPHVLGKLEDKMTAMESALKETTDESDRLELQLEMQRVQIEYVQIRDVAETISRKLFLLSQLAHGLEHGGFDENESVRIRKGIDDILTDIRALREGLTYWLQLIGVLRTLYKRPERLLPNQIQASPANPVEVNKLDELMALDEKQIALVGTWPDAEEEFYLGGAVRVLKNWAGQIAAGTENINDTAKEWLNAHPATAVFEDQLRQYKTWHGQVRNLIDRLEKLRELHRLAVGAERRLDDRFAELWRDFNNVFMLAVPAWQFPDVNFLGFGESSLDFRLEVFLDDTIGDHFERQDDVTTELRTAIVQKFAKSGIEIPFPQRDVWFRNELSQKSSASEPKT